ncbi:MAG TPA: 2-dehydropantoate 2-reductase [Geminicoccaceae bacterium]
MRIVVIGAGAMGGSYGGLLAESGHDVALVDTWEEHVRAIERDGLLVDGARGEHRLRLPVTTGVAGLEPADVVICFVDSNNTRAAAAGAAEVCRPDGFAITFQNGIGNVEALQAAVGPERVLGGSSMCSAAVVGPGHVRLTHHATTSLGEIGGGSSPRAERLAEALRGAGLESRVVPDVMATIWTKFALNCAINAICATTGLRLGEVVRVPELDAFQHRVIDEVLAVAARKGVALTDPDLRKTVKDHCQRKFSRPSMLQHVDAGRRTEIDALNGALVREAKAIDLPVPYNESLVALLKGRELREIRRHTLPNLDFEAWEAKVRAGDPSPEPPVG